MHAPTNNQQKWLKDCNQMMLIRLASKYTKKVREFLNSKLLHRRIATNDFKKIGAGDNPNCAFCNEEEEKLLHLFWSCPNVVSVSGMS